MKKSVDNSMLLRILPLVMGLVLGILFCRPGHCLEPPEVTPIDEFFVENNDSGVQVPPPDWRLIVDGLVEQPLALTLEEILEYPSQTYMATIECGGNPFAFRVLDLIDNGIWTGIPVSTILDSAAPFDNAASVIFTGLDDYSARISLEDIYERDDIMLAYGMNDEILPPEQGFPLRLTIPGSTGGLWVQWVTHVEVTSQEVTRRVPPLPQHCQMFTPEHEQIIDLGIQRIYGMALAGDLEIDAVEVSTDGGFSWQPAVIYTEYVPNAWRNWEFYWTPPVPGNYTLVARATDTSGAVQPQDGIYGWEMFSIEITVEGSDVCVNGTDCSDGLFCNGEEICDRGMCVVGIEPCADRRFCAENLDLCVECIIDANCAQGEVCRSNECVPEITCTLQIKPTQVKVKNTNKDKKKTFSITGGPDFDPYADVTISAPYTIDEEKTTVNKKGTKLKLKTIIPAGSEIPTGTVRILVGTCGGEVPIKN